MSVRSGRVVKTVRTFTRPAPEAPCAFSTYSCSLPRLDGFEYCNRHILEDKAAPYRQCGFTFPSSGKRCLRPAPTTDRKDGKYCLEHSRRSLVVRQRAARRSSPRQTPETLLSMLSHHQMDTHTAGLNAIPDPASVPGLAATALEYASDTDSEDDAATMPQDALPRREADSELDSADSDVDPLEHAEVFTTEEITRIYLEKLQKLKSMYMGEYKRLIHILRESRRKYLLSVRQEKETMSSIHSQPKNTPEERQAYEQLKALARYHKHLGTHAVLLRQQFERRLQVTEGANYRPGTSIGCVKCVYSEGSWRCGEKSMPLSKYCYKHILHDSNQVLFGACGVSKCGDDQCSTPFPSVPYASTCIYHTPIPNPIPVSSAPVDEGVEGAQVEGCGGVDEDFLYTHAMYGHLPPPSPRNIIDLPEAHSFIVTELPPDNVMEGDDDQSTEKEIQAGQVGSQGEQGEGSASQGRGQVILFQTQTQDQNKGQGETHLKQTHHKPQGEGDTCPSQVKKSQEESRGEQKQRTPMETEDDDDVIICDEDTALPSSSSHGAKPKKYEEEGDEEEAGKNGKDDISVSSNCSNNKEEGSGDTNSNSSSISSNGSSSSSNNSINNSSSSSSSSSSSGSLDTQPKGRVSQKGNQSKASGTSK